MKTFIGNIEAKTDAKGRVFLPSVYRRMLSDTEREKMVMRRDPDNACLILYPESVWNKKVEDFKEKLDEWDAEDQMLLMQFVSDAEWLDIDSQGRILLAKRNLQAINAASDVLFVGMLDRIAIWDKTTYEAAEGSKNDFAKQLAEKMKKRTSD